jgi:hypothetical protein
MVGGLVGLLLLILRLGIGLGLLVVRGLVRVLLVRVVRVLLLILPAVAGRRRLVGRAAAVARVILGTGVGVLRWGFVLLAQAQRKCAVVRRIPPDRERVGSIIAGHERERVIVALDRRFVLASQELQIAEQIVTLGAQLDRHARPRHELLYHEQRARHLLAAAGQRPGVIRGLTGIVPEAPTKPLTDAEQSQP